MINVGIDVHKKKCVVTIKDDTGKVLEQTSFDNNKAGIELFAKRTKFKFGKKIRAVCESTANYWIMVHDILEDNGIDTTLVHPGKVKIIAHARIKDDKIDSSILADLLRMNMLPESYVPDKIHRNLRMLARTRLGKVGESTRCKNKVQSILAKYDYTLPTKNVFSKSAITILKEIELSDIDKIAVDMYLDDIENIQRQIKDLERNIAPISCKDERVRLIMTIPGISYILGPTIVSEIVDIKRFSTPEKLVSYAGLVPSRRDSADTHKGGGITKQGSTWLRHGIVDAAGVALQHDPRLKAIYTRVKKRRGWQKAKIATARHLTEIVWHILTNKEEYRTQNQALTQRKYKKMQYAVNSS